MVHLGPQFVESFFSTAIVAKAGETRYNEASILASHFMLFIASDHAGFQLKKFLSTQCTKTLKLALKDLGPEKFDAEDDFPDFALPLAQNVVKNKNNRGILICGSGHGMCIAANKVKGARAILGSSIEGAEMGRKEEDANILCLSGRILSHEHALAIVKRFLETEFDDQEKRERRLQKITSFEAK